MLGLGDIPFLVLVIGWIFKRTPILFLKWNDWTIKFLAIHNLFHKHMYSNEYDISL